MHCHCHSGKSTLLQSLVGNTEKLGGSLMVPESLAFQPQTPILFDQVRQPTD